jgi:CheY-like chemotaxis protein
MDIQRLTVKATAERLSRMTLREVGPWAYVPNASPDDIHQMDIDMAIIKFSFDGTNEGAPTAEEMRTMQIGADGSRRLILCELAIAMADPRRPYWKWGDDYPPWVFGLLGSGYAVNLVASQWHKILHDEVRKIVDAGFDGIWLDCRYPVMIGKELVDLVNQVRTHGLPIVMANAEHLIDLPGFEAEAIGKNGLFSVDNELDRTEAIAYLSATEKPVFIVESCLWDNERISELRRLVSEHGWNPCVVTDMGCV